MRWDAIVNLSDPCERKRKMWRWVVSILLLEHIVCPQPLSEDEKSVKQPRQLDFRECCPCPDSNVESSFSNQGHWLNNNGNNMIELSRNAGQFTHGFSRSSGFDDCPCRYRSTDSEGSSSIFFPSAMRLTGSLGKSPDSKEDPKNLLEPEVGLASSVLETLREATDEEYRDALARDAARARAIDDAIPEESAQNIVTIILPSAGDEEDITQVSKLSHIQEPRCIHPLGSSLSRMTTPVPKSLNVLTESFRMPESKRMGLMHRGSLHVDNGLGASNVVEHITDINGRNNKLLRSDKCDVHFKKDPSFKSVSILKKDKELSQRTKSLSDSNTMMNMKSVEEFNRNTDMKSAASDMKELLSDKLNLGLKLGSITSESSPLNIKNLLKLRDVELVPPGQLIEKLKLGQPILQLPPLIENMSKLSDLLKNGINFDLNKNNKWNSVKKDDKSLEENTSNTNIQVIPRDKTLTTDVLDALPSTSNMNEVKDNCKTGQESVEKEPNSVSEVKTMSTEIIDSIPSSSFPIEANYKVLIDNDLSKEAKIDGDNNCNLTESENEDMASDEMISSQSQSNLSVPNINSQANVQSNVAGEGKGQDMEPSILSESISVERGSSENIDRILIKNDDASNFDIETRNSNREELRVADRQSKDTSNNKEMLNGILNKHKESPLSKSLTSVRENILRKIEDRKKSSKWNQGDRLREPNTEKPEENLNTDCLNEPSENVLSVLTDPLDIKSKRMKSSKVSNTVHLEDLQNLSDSLLRKSFLNEKSVPAIDDTECDKDLKADVRSLPDKIDKSLSFENDDLTINSEAASGERRAIEIKEPPITDVVRQNFEENSSPIDIKDSTCVSSSTEDFLKFLRSGPDVNEMTAEASEPVVGTQWHNPLKLFKSSNLGSPLFQDIVVQPSSIFEGIKSPSSLDLEGTLKFPTLDDIRERLANVFGTNDKDFTDEDIDCPNEQPVMSAEPSISNFISRSSVTPMKDLNLDVFQLKPLTVGKSSTVSKIPGLNLKSFRTKVPIPKNLDLKPLKLQSTVGNEGGLLGASLTLGRDSEGTSKLFGSLGNPLQNLPSLDDMMTRMRTNIESLVNSPLDLSRSMDTIPRISDLSNYLKLDTENTLRALKERMGSTLGQGSTLLSNSPKKPQELIERIVDAKEDLDAKLKGLHYDFNDRLTSFHENILDQTGLSSLNPLFPANTLGSRNVFNNNNQNIDIKRLNTPTSKRLKLEGKKGSLDKTATYKNRPSVERKVNSIASQRKLKMPASASVPVPKTIEIPKLKSTLDNSLSSSGSDLKKRIMTSRTKTLGLPNKLDDLPRLSSKPSQEKSVLGKKTNSLKEKIVKVTFGSTSPSPLSPLRSQQRSNSRFQEVSTEDFKRPESGLARRIGFKSRNEPKGSPSEVQLTRIQLPMNIDSRNCDNDFNSLEQGPFSNDNGGNMREATKEQKNPKSSKVLDSTKAVTESRSTNKNPILPLPTWPKDDDNSFLSKVRDAVKARLSNFDPKKAISDGEIKTNSDMERSASKSKNTDVVVGENLKENVSYKCRMVCTKS